MHFDFSGIFRHRQITLLLILVVLLVGAGLSLYGWGYQIPRRHAEVAWDPEEIELTLSPGEIWSFGVEATVRHPFAPSPVLSLSPSLNPFISVEESEESGRGRNITYRFNVLVSIPFDTAKGTIRGEIQLARARPDGFPLPVSPASNVLPVVLTIEGTRAIDPDGRYAITIPEGWSFSFEGNDHVLVAHPNDLFSGKDETPRVTLAIDPNPEVLSIEEYYDGDPGIDLFGQSSTIATTTVDGLTAYQFEPFMTLAGTVLFVVPAGDKFVVLTDEGAAFQDDGTFQRLLNSLSVGGE